MAKPKTLYERARSVRASGVSSAQARRELASYGYSAEEISAVLWRVGYRDWKTMSSVGHIKELTTILGIVAFITLLFGITMIIERRRLEPDSPVATSESLINNLLGDSDDDMSSQNVSVDDLGGEQRSFQDASISFVVPDQWSLETLTDPEQPGIHAWQLRANKNDEIQAELDRKYGQVDADANFAEESVTDILSDPLIGQFRTVTISVATAPEIEIEKNLDLWLETVEDVQSVIGLEIMELEEFTLDGVTGYQYVSSVSAGDVAAFTRDYIFLRDRSRVEISLFPSDGEAQSFLQAIVDSIKFL